jgi:Glyoxalase-like domain
VSLRWEELVIDSRDFRKLGHWWSDAMEWSIILENEDELEIQNPDGAGPTILFINVPESKTAKNRLHLDLVPDDQEAEVERLIGLGASRVDIGQGETSWTVLADPEGNEFCVLSARSA